MIKVYSLYVYHMCKSYVRYVVNNVPDMQSCLIDTAAVIF